MDAFEAVISMLLRHDGYWTTPSFKVELTKAEKVAIGRHSSPRWELDLVAYCAAKNEILIVECKSYLDSGGVLFRNGLFQTPNRYKLFTDDTLRNVVVDRMTAQLLERGSCRAKPKVTLCLAAGKFAGSNDLKGLRSHFKANHWQLFEPKWIHEGLRRAATKGYENDIAFVVSKLLLNWKASTDD